MSNPEGVSEIDQRLKDPDGYFETHYKGVKIPFGDQMMTIENALAFERQMREPGSMEQDSKAWRANILISKLREVGALREEDDIIYPEAPTTYER